MGMLLLACYSLCESPRQVLKHTFMHSTMVCTFPCRIHTLALPQSAIWPPGISVCPCSAAVVGRCSYESISLTTLAFPFHLKLQARPHLTSLGYNNVWRTAMLPLPSLSIRNCRLAHTPCSLGYNNVWGIAILPLPSLSI
uniref:Uncharacterized protein n=1 Tax=Dunaliella tertiolecta TaxID=3047 RepID=A0A7S3R3X9_DUNTE